MNSYYQLRLRKVEASGELVVQVVEPDEKVVLRLIAKDDKTRDLRKYLDHLILTHNQHYNLEEALLKIVEECDSTQVDTDKIKKIAKSSLDNLKK